MTSYNVSVSPHLLSRALTYYEKQYNLTSLTGTCESPPHGVVLHIRTTRLASFKRYRHFDPTKMGISQTEFVHMMELAFDRPLSTIENLVTGGLVVTTVP